MTVGVLPVLFGLASTLFMLVVAYYVIRLAVRDAIVDADRKMDSERVRSELRLGPERSPNSRA